MNKTPWIIGGAVAVVLIADGTTGARVAGHVILAEQPGKAERPLMTRGPQLTLERGTVLDASLDQAVSVRRS